MIGVTRRRLLRVAASACLGGAMAACRPRVVHVERVVEKQVTTVVTEIVRETVLVRDTPRAGETLATPTLPPPLGTPQPTARPRVALVADVTRYGWTAFGQAMAPAFEELFPTIRLEWRTTADWDTYPARVAALMASGQAGDLLEAPFGPLLTDWFERGMIRPLDDVLAAEHYDTTGVFAGALAACTRSTSLAALPLVCHGGDCLLVYNRDLLNAVGADTPMPDWIVDHVTRAGAAVTRGLGSEIPPAFGYGEEHRLPGAYPAMRVFGAELLDAEGRASAIDDAAGIAYLRWLQALVRGARAAPHPHEIEGGLATMFADGRLAMVRADLWSYLAHLRRLGAERLGGILFPPTAVGGARGAVLRGVAYCISARSAHVAEAFQWIKYLSGREMGVQMFLRGYAEPGCRSASWNDPRVLELCPTCARVAEVTETAAPERVPWNLRLADVAAIWDEEAARLVRGDVSPEECADAVTTRIDAALALE